MDSTKLIETLQASTLSEEQKQALISKVQEQGLSDEVKQSALEVIDAHVSQLEDKAVEADQKLRDTLQQVAPEVMTEFTPEVEKQEQLKMVAEEAERRINVAEEDFKEERQATEQILDAVEQNLQADEAKTIAE